MRDIINVSRLNIDIKIVFKKVRKQSQTDSHLENTNIQLKGSNKIQIVIITDPYSFQTMKLDKSLIGQVEDFTTFNFLFTIKKYNVKSQNRLSTSRRYFNVRIG